MSDLHLVTSDRRALGRFDTVQALEHAICHWNSREPSQDLVIITGDLVDRGEHQEYLTLQKMLSRLEAPVVVIPGNHDDPLVLGEVMGPDHPYLMDNRGRAFSIDDLPFVLLGINTVVPGSPHGLLENDQLEWLGDQLSKESDSRPVILVMHHPPFRTGIGPMDSTGLRNAHAFWRVMKRSSRPIARILCGHLHRPIVAELHGIMTCVAPSIAFAISLDLSERHSGVMYTDEQPAIAIHHALPDGFFVTHFENVGPSDGA